LNTNKQVTHISIKNMSYNYSQQDSLLKNINLNVLPGEKVGIVGSNGSGKTTLFLLLSGILTPDTGDISILNSPVKAKRFNPDIGFVFQNPDHQLFCPTVSDDLAFGLLNLGYSKEETQKLVEQYLKGLNMLDLSDRPPHNLSGGEKRMISIGGVLIMNPQVVILDEPESSLDSKARRKLINFLQQTEETLLVASHDLEFLLETCERTIILNDGVIAIDGKSKEVMGNKELMESFGLEKPHSLVPHAEMHHQ